MTSHTTDSTDSTTPKTTRRRTLAALAASTFALPASAGCLTNDTGSNTTDDSGMRDSPQLPDVFESVSVGAYELTVEVSNPEELDSVGLRRPTSGLLDRQQAQGTHSFPLMEELDLYEPGEFVLEAKADSEVVAEHTFEMEPDIRITNIEFLENSSLEELTSSRSESSGTVCAEKAKTHLFTVENSGTGPAAVRYLKADFPDSITGTHRSKWETRRSLYCHARERTDWTTTPVLAPGQVLTFAPMGAAEAGYIRQSLESKHVIQLSLLDQASDTWFTQDVQMGFEKAGDDTYFPVFETQQED